MAITTYGDISPRTALYAQKKLLERAVPHLLLEMFGQGFPIPERSSRVTSFRRYEALDPTPSVLVEGVTPAATPVTMTNITATLLQYGRRVTITDIVEDTHEDPIISEMIAILGEQAGIMLETVRWGVVRAGTSVQFANGTSRNDVNTVLNHTLQQRVTRALKRQNAMTVTSRIASTPNFNTVPVAPSYVALCHPDLETDIRAMTGFRSVEEYGQVSPYPSEIGRVVDVRYLTSTVFGPFTGLANRGGATSTMIRNDEDNTRAMVYPILYLAQNAFGIVPFKGLGAVTPFVVNRKHSDSDVMGQRTHIGWKAMQATAILNDAFMVRAEVAVTA